MLLERGAPLGGEPCRGPWPHQKARQWRLDHIRDYLAARDWMQATADLVIDTTTLTASQAARSVHQAVQAVQARK
jgi:hypothetical protein